MTSGIYLYKLPELLKVGVWAVKLNYAECDCQMDKFLNVPLCNKRVACVESSFLINGFL